MGRSNPEYCSCASCYQVLAMARADASINAGFAMGAPRVKKEVMPTFTRQESLRDKIERQRKERFAEIEENWRYHQDNKERYADIAKGSDEMNTKWLTVPKGQLTFQSEGNDKEGSPYFTRIPHVPNNKGVVIGRSGITFGRGLDIGSRSAADISNLFSEVAKHCKPLSSELLEWLKGGAGLKGQDAYEYYKTLNQKVPKHQQELTRKQQHFLFMEIYPFYEKETERLLTKLDVRSSFDKDHVIDWQMLPINVKEVLVDLTYRGDNQPASRKVIVPALVLDVKNGLTKESSNLYKVMKDKVWMSSFGVDLNRYESRYKELIK